jgi:farnesyl diphosphate synthase
MGLGAAQEYAKTLHDQAFAALAYFQTDAAAELYQISQFLLARQS